MQSDPACKERDRVASSNCSATGAPLILYRTDSLQNRFSLILFLFLLADRGGLLIKIFCVKKDFHNMHIFIKLLEPLFDGPSKQSNYGDFQRRSLNIASSSHSSESSSTTPNSSTKTNADSKPSSSLSSEISDVKSSSNISSGMTPPESPNSRKRRTPDDDASLDDEASSLDQTSPFSPGKQQSHPISPKAPTPNINFYKKEGSICTIIIEGSICTIIIQGRRVISNVRSALFANVG